MAKISVPKHWLDLSLAERQDAVIAAGLPAFRAGQINRQIFVNHSLDPNSWTDLPKAIREPIAAEFFPSVITRLREQSCDAGATVKTLWQLADGRLIESVLMKYGVPGAPAAGRPRATLCLSSQAGCGMGCPFCATGQLGLDRSLTTAEMLAQVLAANERLSKADGPARLTNLVFMGMGEPLANYNRVLKTIRTIVAAPPEGLGLSARGITVSTVGLAPKIDKLAAEGLPVTLAVSLHAPNDALRDELVPINKRYPLAEVVASAHNYFAVTGRRVSIEYALMRDINDAVGQARELAALLNRQGRGWVHVNVIPLNPTPGSKWTASRRKDQAAFVAVLEQSGIPVTVRDTRGQEIDGACGQLAAAQKSG